MATYALMNAAKFSSSCVFDALHYSHALPEDQLVKEGKQQFPFSNIVAIVASL